jgi:hypothetical protein
MNRPFTSESEVKAVVTGFETCQTDKTAFPHMDHLTVAAYYLQTSDVPAAIDRMRDALFRFIDHHGVERSKYHETITCFWVEMVARELSAMTDGMTLVEQCNRVIESLSDKEHAFIYYSPELLSSDQARATFVNPDLKTWR